MVGVRKLYLPKADTEEEAEDAFHKMCQALVIELGQKFEKVGQAQLGDDWLEELVAQGGDPQEISNWTSPFDPSFVFSQPLKYHDSLLWRVLPNNAEFYNNYKSCRWARNRWEHRQISPSLEQLKKDMKYFYFVAQEAKLSIEGALPQLLQRINNILSGSFNPETSAEEPVTVSAEETSEEVQVAVEKDDAEKAERTRERTAAKSESRPRVGGRWIGPKPTRALKFKRQLNDLTDVETKESVKHLWGDEAALQIARLKMIDPMGDIFVDDSDGALFGYKHGQERLLGYLGAEPERDLSEVQGFSLPYSYSLTENGIVCESTGENLSKVLGENARTLTAVLKKAVNPLDELKITTHGDLYSLTEQGPVKIARVSSTEWFPNHLADSK
ncbi:hypothetical protein AINA4_02410 [Aurantimicrobium sp. INA4]|uniref:hypothetical protein n=1 Tax=Aurantimicrobium sp. INA4 TaxID=2986279 RepID=UPI0024925ADA|nr:hypothetical protein [Aurantimicrobium sp. INA4]BDU10320.1 hypothetical protein AINA4_02410 [Aurantimicrobium sp. INA4]